MLQKLNGVAQSLSSYTSELCDVLELGTRVLCLIFDIYFFRRTEQQDTPLHIIGDSVKR